MSDSWGCCGGKCCSNSGAPDMDRRDFLKAAAAAGGLALVGAGRGAYGAEPGPEEVEALKAWTRDLWKRGERRVYRGEGLSHIVMPLGGIGAGQVYLTGQGRLDSWQIVNNFNTGAHAPGQYFGVWTRTEDGRTTARLLQEGNSDGVSGVTAVEFSGEYPFAWIKYLDGQLPVDVSMEACTPFVPLSADESGLPVALFRFTLTNRSAKPVEAAVLATAPNLVGWDGYAAIEGNRLGDFIANANALGTSPQATVLNLGTRPGTPAAFSTHRDIYTNDAEAGGILRFCENAKVRLNEAPMRAEDIPAAVIWAGRSEGLASDDVRRVLDAVRGGAALVICGGVDGLLGCAVAEGARGDVVFEDWEKRGYAGWTLEGDCFGKAPATATLPNQGKVSGWRGKGYVNTYVGGDDATGRAVSTPFTVEKRFIHFQIGGGNHKGETCLNLVIDGQVAASSTGDNTEVLKAARWDVAAHAGKQATLEIVDSRRGGWGHVLVGDIVFSDSPLAPFVDPEVATACRDALPLSCTGMTETDTPIGVTPGSSLLMELHASEVRAGKRAVFEGLELKPGAHILLEAEDGTPLAVAGRFGKGSVVLCSGPLLEWLDLGDRRTVAGRLAAEAANVGFAPQTGWAPESVVYGSMALAALGEGLRISTEPQWEDFAALWEDFAADGRLEGKGPGDASAAGRTWFGALSASAALQPGETRVVTYALAWHFPNRTRDNHYGWGFRFPKALQYDYRLGNRYNNRFKSAAEVAAYVAENFERLDGATRLFHETFNDSTLPQWLLDGVSANLANIRSPIFVWLEDGSFGGFEGADNCCPMNCTHVYNYVMSTAYLFPELERNVREIDLLAQMHPEEHFIPHRTILPLSEPRAGNEIGGPLHHALDGELGTLLKAYREWRFDGDNAWLDRLWPNMRKVMEHVMRDHDAQGDGVIRGEQPNTYDTHLYGSNSFIGALYLATLRAMEEMAKARGEADFAAACRERFEKGREGYDRSCWNGEYYENKFDAPGADPAVYNDNNCYGPGCLSDQLLGQWWAWTVDLGEVLPADRIKTTLQSIYKYNWRSDLSGHAHNQRIFALGREKGLLVGSWPLGGRPERPILYCDEVWTGIEYHVAASLILAGLVEQGLQLAKGARDRYTGDQRNPFAEVECGHHYARALSSYSLLTAASGTDYDGPSRRLTLAPRVSEDAFRCFFSADGGWGQVSRAVRDGAPRYGVSVRDGAVRVSRLRVPNPGEGFSAKVSVGGKPIAAQLAANGGFCDIAFDEVRVNAGQTLEVDLRQA